MASAAPEVHVVHDEEGTRALAERLAPELVRGDVVALVGDLGAGKTAFVRHLAAALGLADGERVASPSYALVHEYFLKEQRGGTRVLAHLDLYRVSGEDELAGLGFDELCLDAIVAIEWPERAPSTLAVASHVLRFEVLGESARSISIERRQRPSG